MLSLYFIINNTFIKNSRSFELLDFSLWAQVMSPDCSHRWKVWKSLIDIQFSHCTWCSVNMKEVFSSVVAGIIAFTSCKP